MSFSPRKSLHPANLRLVLLSLICVVLSCEVSDAGVIVDTTQWEARELSGAQPLETPPEDPPWPSIESPGPENGMTASSFGGTEVQPPVSIAFLRERSNQPQLVQWLTIQSRLRVPSPVPDCLLKVPIFVG